MAPLNRLKDRCDRCGAEAFVRVTSRQTNNDLLFCGHHYRAHEMALVMGGWIVDDHRSEINTNPSPSANAA